MPLGIVKFTSKFNFMSYRSPEEKIEHQRVILASASTYLPLKDKGYVISVNPEGQQNHDIGGSRYPDVVVWKPADDPDYPRTIIIEEVETTQTVNEKEASEWKKYADAGARFFLVVPLNLVGRAREISRKYKIAVERVEAYWINGDQVFFETNI